MGGGDGLVAHPLACVDVAFIPPSLACPAMQLTTTGSLPPSPASSRAFPRETRWAQAPRLRQRREGSSTSDLLTVAPPTKTL